MKKGENLATQTVYTLFWKLTSPSSWSGKEATTIFTKEVQKNPSAKHLLWQAEYSGLLQKNICISLIL